MREDGIRSLGVCSAKLTSAAANCTDDQRQGELSAKHIMQFRGLIDDVVHRGECKVNGHQLSDRSLTDHGGTDCTTDNGVFCNGSIFDSFGTVFIVKTFGDGIGTAPNTDFFAHNKDCSI